MAKLKAPEDVCSFSFEGKEYEVKRGSIDVPDEAIPVALFHGFTVPVAKTKDSAVEAETQE
jgi:hypothetical protein